MYIVHGNLQLSLCTFDVKIVKSVNKIVVKPKIIFSSPEDGLREPEKRELRL